MEFRRKLLIGSRRTTRRRNQWLALSQEFPHHLDGAWVMLALSWKVLSEIHVEGSGDAPSKIKALRDAGIVVSESAGLIGKHMLEEMKRHKLA